MKKRLISMLLVLSVLISFLLPGIGAYADNGDGTEPSEPVTELAEALPEEDTASEENGTEESSLPSEEPNEAAAEEPSEKPAEESENAEPDSEEAVEEENAEEENAEEDAALLSFSDESPADDCDFAALFSAKLYIAADYAAGLDGSVSVAFRPLSCAGTVYLPGSADTEALFLSWDDESIVLSRGEEVYTSGTAPIAPAGERLVYRVTRGKLSALISVRTEQGSQAVGGMFLTLDENLGTIAAMNADPTHETSCYGSVSLDGEFYPYMSMKGRGNSTWELDKKPYNLTFYKAGDYDKKQKAELITGVKAKKWSLLANYLDTSLIRNKVGLDLASELGIGLDARFVDLWMNGEYLGNYLLTPKNDYQAPDGGYVVENDNYLSDDPQFSLPGMQEPANIDGFHNLMSIKDIGDDAVDAGENAETIEAYFLQAWDALLDYDSDEYLKYFDLDSWAKQYLMYEVTKTYDVFSGSLLMHRDGLTEDDKITAGPAWDMDNSFGRTIIKLLSGVAMYNQLTAEGWYVDSVGYIADDSPVSLLQELSKHASFKQRISEIYNDYLWAFESIVSDIDYQSSILSESAKMDYERWGDLRLSVYYTPAPLVLGSGDYTLYYEPTFTWENYINNMRHYVTKRVQYMSDHLCVEHPVGEIIGETEIQSGDTLELTASLSAGNGNSSFVWQSKVKKGEWRDIDGADGAVLKLTVTDADNGTKYRCIVRNSGARINMLHGETAYASAQTVLDSVSISVKAHEHRYERQVIEPSCTEEGCTKFVCRCGDFYTEGSIPPNGHSYSGGFCTVCGAKDPDAVYAVRKEKSALADGELTLVMNGKELGEFTFRKVSGGWTVCDGEGRYLAAEGKALVRTDAPFVWKYTNGIFTAEVRLSFTKLGELLGLKHTDHVYLAESKGNVTLSLLSGTKAGFLKSVEYLVE